MRKAGEGGFALVAVLLLLLVLTLVAQRLDVRVAGFRETATGWRNLAEAEADMATASNDLLYVMLTSPMKPWGFGDAPEVLRADGRVYERHDGVRLSVQDMRGLISIATPQAGVLQRFLQQAGAPEKEIEQLLGKLADYADPDDLKRLNGAERKEYAAAGLPPPRNDWPLSAWELRRVMGWDAHPEIWGRAGDFFSVARDEWINPNFAPRQVLMALAGATPAGVDALMKRREILPFQHEADVAAVSGIALPPDEPAQFSSSLYYRIRAWTPAAPRAVEWTVMLTPGGVTTPWLIMERRNISNESLAAPDRPPQAFPAKLLAGRSGVAAGAAMPLRR